MTVSATLPNIRRSLPPRPRVANMIKSTAFESAGSTSLVNNTTWSPAMKLRVTLVLVLVWGAGGLSALLGAAGPSPENPAASAPPIAAASGRQPASLRHH